MPDSSAESAAEAVTAPVPAAGEDRLHVVFGTGQVGRVLAVMLAARGCTVRVVSRHRPAALADRIEWRAADAADTDAASDAAKGAAVIYQCLNAPYTEWPERFPRCSEAHWQQPSGPARYWSAWKTSTATAQPGASR